MNKQYWFCSTCKSYFFLKYVIKVNDNPYCCPMCKNENGFIAPSSLVDDNE
jgi:rubrerythrin